MDKDRGMSWISTTIKRKYMDKILSGEKTIEYKGATPFWHKRLQKFICQDRLKNVGINFLCGKQSYKFRVNFIEYFISLTCHSKTIIDDGRWDCWYEIHLGEQLRMMKKGELVM